ncbi:MAG TPA: hypothetical protein V6D08_06320 [Candidatus Obscuribacterales bacterium]
MAEQLELVEQTQAERDDSSAATLAEFARLIYRVANDLSREKQEPACQEASVSAQEQ